MRRRVELMTSSVILVVIVASTGALMARRSDDQLSPQEQTQRIAEGLRCPVCQNLSAADSPSRLAAQMRDRIQTMLKKGRTPDQIRAYFVAAYGQWVLLDPAREGVGMITWLVPLTAFVSGGVAVAVALRRRPKRPVESPTAAERLRIERQLEALDDPL